MSNFSYTIPTKTTTYPLPGSNVSESTSFGVNIISDPDGVLTAGANTSNYLQGFPPTALGFITNLDPLNYRTLTYTIDIVLDITQNGLGNSFFELYIGPLINPNITNSNSILLETQTGVFNYTFQGTINIPPNQGICLWGVTYLASYTLDVGIIGSIDGLSVTITNGNAVEFFCDQSPNCLIPNAESRIICDEIELIECNAGDCPVLTTNNGLILCAETDSWNCNLCGNDLQYNSPVVPGDDLYFQFQQQDIWNGNSPTLPWGNNVGWDEFGLVQGYIRDCCTGAYLQNTTLSRNAFVTDYSNNYFVGIFETSNYSGSSLSYPNIQQIKIETSQLAVDVLQQFGHNCFYFEFVFNPIELAYTYNLYSEPFEFVTCKNTILIEGDYNIKDCFNLYYGDPGCITINQPIEIGPITINNYVKDCQYFYGTGLFPYRQYYRVYGSFEQTSFEINKELVGTRLKSTSIDFVENWLLRTDRLPYRAAKLVATMLASQNVYINNTEYVVDGEIPKNNEVGNQWFIEANVRKVNCSKNYSCN